MANIKKIFRKEDYDRIEKIIDDITVMLTDDICNTPLLDMVNEIGIIQAKQETLEGLKTDVEFNLVVLKNILDRLKDNYSHREEFLLINDPAVKDQSSKELRLAKAHEDDKIKEIASGVRKISNMLNKAKAIKSRVDGKYNFLESSYEKLSRQLSGVKQVWEMAEIDEESLDKMIGKVENLKGTSKGKLG